mmetsp:Transcript_39459/g.112955  ORF Transcript_39459/g.112955 Transcript_39459/m.112955 type:complete len:369 (-) Transcript_39459:225-1331(-)
MSSSCTCVANALPDGAAAAPAAVLPEGAARLRTLGRTASGHVAGAPACPGGRRESSVSSQCSADTSPSSSSRCWPPPRSSRTAAGPNSAVAAHGALDSQVFRLAGGILRAGGASGAGRARPKSEMRPAASVAPKASGGACFCGSAGAPRPSGTSSFVDGLPLSSQFAAESPLSSVDADPGASSRLLPASRLSCVDRTCFSTWLALRLSYSARRLSTTCAMATGKTKCPQDSCRVGRSAPITRRTRTKRVQPVASRVTAESPLQAACTRSSNHQLEISGTMFRNKCFRTHVAFRAAGDSAAEKSPLRRLATGLKYAASSGEISIVQEGRRSCSAEVMSPCASTPGIRTQRSFSCCISSRLAAYSRPCAR